MLSEKPTATAWQPWSKQAEESARQTGPVFVDFTADWCITCKVVEATVLDTEAAQTLFRTTGTTIFKADWTKRDDAITAELTAHGRKGVPLYLVYPQGAAQPIILPQLPTLADIETALQTRE